MALTSQQTKAFCLFVVNVIPLFDEANIKLQAEYPLVHKLRRVLLALFRNLLIKFVKPAHINAVSNILDVDFRDVESQRSDTELVIGTETQEVASGLNIDESRAFYASVRAYFVKGCDYILLKFPFDQEFLKHAEVADISLKESAVFASLKYFIQKFPVLLENHETGLKIPGDKLQEQFATYQVTALSADVCNTFRADEQWHKIGLLKDECGYLCFDILAKVMLGILSIPHSNASCERMFSLVNKNKSQSRSSMNDKTLCSLITTKVDANNTGACYQQKPTDKLLLKAKRATVESLATAAAKK